MDIHQVEGQVRALKATLESGNVAISMWGNTVVKHMNSSSYLDRLVSQAFSIHKLIKTSDATQVDQEALGRVKDSLKTLANGIDASYGKADTKKLNLLQRIISQIASLFLSNPRSDLVSYTRTISEMSGVAFIEEIKRAPASKKRNKGKAAEPLIAATNAKEIKAHYKAKGYKLRGRTDRLGIQFVTVEQAKQM